MKTFETFLFYTCVFLFTISYVIAKDTVQKNKPLRVLFWVNNFPTNTGGSTLNQIIGFVKNGHDVTILTQNFNDSSFNMSHPDIIEHDLLSKIFVQQLPEDKRSFDFILCQSTSLALSLIDFVTEHTIQGKRIVFVRGADLKIFYDKKKCEKIFDFFDCIAPVCDFFKKKLQALAGADDKIQVLHSSIDCDTFFYKERTIPTKDQKIFIVSTSRLAAKKGLEYAIKAMKILADNGINFHYYIIGDGSQKGKLEILIQRLGLKDRITLLGLKTPLQIVEILHNCHLFTLPSVTAGGAQEGIPNAVKEAMAIGLPVISTYHAGIPELVEDGVTGFLVPERDETALAEKILYVIKSTEIWNSIGIAARQFIEDHFEREKENQNLITLCRKLL